MQLTNIELAGIVIVVLSLAFLLADVVANKKASLLGWLVLLIVLFAYVDKFYLDIVYNQYLAGISQSETIFLAAGGLTLALSLWIFAMHTASRRAYDGLYRYAITQDNSQILAFISKKHKMLHMTDKFSDIITPTTDSGQFKLFAVSIDDKKIELKRAGKALAQCNGKLNEPCKVKFTFSNALTMDYDVTKKQVLFKKKKLGYVLVDNAVSQSYKLEIGKEFKKNLFIYLDLFNTPLAYFDQDQNTYVASHALLDVVGFKGNQVSKEELLEKMHPTDIPAYESRKIEEGKRNKVYFRLQTNNDYVWFEESTARYFNTNFILVKRIDALSTSKVVFGNYKAMIKTVSDLCEAKSAFGLVIMNLSNITQMSVSLGKEMSDILVGKFFTKILNGPLKGQVKVYKLGATEFALVIENGEYTQLVIRNLHNNTSEIASQNISINNTNYRIECELGIVASQDFEELDARAIIKTGFDSLKEASDPDFLKDYSIYQPKKAVTIDYDLKSLGIDLDEDLQSFEDDITDEKTTKN